MPYYKVYREFWWKGLKREVGSTINMSEAQAKYLSHIITPVAPTVAAPAPTRVSRKATAIAPLAVAVAEVPANGSGTH